MQDFYECLRSEPDFPGLNSGQLHNLSINSCHLQNGDEYSCQNVPSDWNNEQISRKPDLGSILQNQGPELFQTVNVTKDKKKGCS